MNKYKLLIIIILSIVSVVVSFKFIDITKFNGNKEEQFSALNVAKDIKVISREPHSIENENSRKMVRAYLYNRLKDLGFNPVIHTYDSIPTRLLDTITISNIYCESSFKTSKAKSYILFIAHYDSRFKFKVLGKYNYSRGAADDGYGLGVILETVRLANKFKERWHQGIKILFTDAEENRLDGMKSALLKNKEVFKDVSLIINVEARGVKGPALLFETSKGNSNVIELYKHANSPYTFSLTSFVYGILPNFTDFSLVKDSIPGMNFAVIDNLNYYHTDLDNYSNISLASIQHYGDQIVPIVKEFLTNTKYSDNKALKSELDSSFLTIPILGMLVLSPIQLLFINIATILIFFLSLIFFIKQKRIRVKNIMILSSAILCISLVMAGIGHLVAYIAADYTGQKFNMVHLPFIKYDYVVIILLIFTSLLLIVFTLKRVIRLKGYSYYDMLFSSCALLLLVAISIYLITKDNILFILPVTLGAISLLLNIIKYFRFTYLISLLLYILVITPFYYCVTVALTIGSIGAILLLITLSLSFMVTLGYAYVRNVAF